MEWDDRGRLEAKKEKMMRREGNKIERERERAREREREREKEVKRKSKSISIALFRSRPLLPDCVIPFFDCVVEG